MTSQERHLSLVAAAAVASLVSAGIFAAPPALSESSSWFTREPDPPAEPPSDRPNMPKLGPAVEHSGTSEIRKTIPSTVPATGDDAAYTAFDQGQYLTALKLAEEAAAKGEPQAYTLIGRIYAEGLGVQRDDHKAYTAYAQAAELGDTAGTFALGIMLAEGRGVEKNRKAAAEMFEKAALTGHAEANYNLGILFLKGDGKPENPIRAYQHIRYAAEKGLAQAQYDLAALYQSGTGVDADALEAARWMAKAADQGLAVAQYDYAVMLLKGFGLKKDEPRAVSLMKSAAEKGISGAQNRLAYIFYEGTAGAEKNEIEAAKWRLIAKKNGYEDNVFDQIVAQMDKKARRKAEAAASEVADRIQLGPEIGATQ